jgi:hypothetical protein
MQPDAVRRARLLRSHYGQRVGWRTTCPEEFPVTVRSIDFNGHCPDDDGPSTAAEAELVADADDFLAFMADRGEPHRASIAAIRRRDRMVRDTLASLEGNDAA